MNIQVLLLDCPRIMFRGRLLPLLYRGATPEDITALDPLLILAEDTGDDYVRMSGMTWNRLEWLFSGPPKANMSVWDY